MRFLLMITLLASLVASPMLIAMSLPCCDHDHQMMTEMQHHADTTDAEHACCDDASSCQADSCQCQLSNVGYSPVSVIPFFLAAVPPLINTPLATLPLCFTPPDRLDRPPILFS